MSFVQVPTSTRASGFRLGLGLCAGAFCCAAAWGQAASTSVPLERQVDEAFRAVFQNPNDLGLTSNYVQLLIRAGNYEGAIAALERLLAVPGSPPSIRIEIANLYGMLRSYVMAETMLNQALADPGLSAADRARAEALLVTIRNAGNPSRFSGALIFGLRQQSNASFLTDAARIFNAGTLINNPLRPRSDTDASMAIRINHEYDLGFNSFAELSTSAGLFFLQSQAAQGKAIVAGVVTPYNLVVGDVTSGVVFKPLAGQPDFSVRPFLSGTFVQAQSASLLTTVGAGADFNYRFGNTGGGVFVTLDSLRRDFATRPDLTAVVASQLSGQLTSVRARWIYPVTSAQALTVDVAVRQNRAGRDFFSFNSVEPRVSYAVSYPGWFGAGNWTTTPFVSYVQRQYRGADPAVGPTARRDAEWRVGVSHAVPIAGRWLGLLTVEQARNNANLPNFNFKNTSVTANLIYSF